MNLRDVASAPLWSTATLLLLAAGCSAGGGGDPGPFHPEDGDGAPTTSRPDSSATPAPPMLSGSASASSGGSTSAATPVVTSNPQPTPRSGDVAGSNSGVAIDHSGSMPSGDGSSGQSSAPPPPETAPLIREAAPTALSASQPGVFGVDTITTGLRDGPDYGTQTLYVPVDAEPPFASAVVVPGFLVPESTIAAWGPFLASHGIVTLTIGTNTPLDLPDVRAKALLDGIETLKGEDQRNGSPLQGHMALDRFAVMGWSMGGGGTLIAANETPTLRAAVTLAAWSPGALFSNDVVPTLLFAGSADPLAGGQSQGFFTSIPESTPKMLFEVAGAAHDVANDPLSASGEIGRYGLAWLKVFLEGDERYRQFLVQTPTTESDFRDNL